MQDGSVNNTIETNSDIEAVRLATTSKAGRGRGSHYHILYINQKLNYTFCAPSNGHQHEVMLAQDGSLEIAPGEEDGHIHIEQEYERDIDDEDQTDDEKVDEVIKLWNAWHEQEQESYEDADESEKFYCGEQWDDSMKQKLDALDRAAVTINHIQKNLDQLFGYQRQSRMDIHYLPTESGDQRQADFYNLMTKHVVEKCDFAWEESLVFEDQCITGRGNHEVIVDYESDIRGRIVVQRYPWDQITYAPHEKRDLSDCEGCVKEKMFSIAKLKQLYPKKAEEIKFNFQSLKHSPEKPIRDKPGDQYSVGQIVRIGKTDYPLVDISRKEFRLIECRRVRYFNAKVLAIPKHNFYYNLWGWKEGDIDKLKAIPGLKTRVFKRNIKKIRITKTAGGVLLSDENPAELPTDHFFMVPVYAKKRRGKYWGKVEPAKDAQTEINKRHSQAIDIGNKCVNYTIFIDENTFANIKEERLFRKNSTSPGYVAKVQDLSKTPLKWEGVKFPSEIVQLLQMGAQNLAEIMNVVVDEMMSQADSGPAMLLREKVKLTGNEFLFDNLSYARRQVGRLLVPLIQHVYTPDRAFRVISNMQASADQNAAAQNPDIFSQEEISYILANTEAIDLDVIVSEIQMSPSARMGIYVMLENLARAGQAITPDIMMEFLDIPESIKIKIKQMMAQQSESAGAQEAETKQMEENKSLIAKAIIPGSVKARLDQEEQEFNQQRNGGQPPEGGGPPAA